MISFIAAVLGAVSGALASLLTTKNIVRKELKIRFTNSCRITLYQLCGSFLSNLHDDSISNLDIGSNLYDDKHISVKSYAYYNALAKYLIENKVMFSNLKNYDYIINDNVGLLIESPNRIELYKILENRKDIVKELQEELSKDIL